MALVHGGDWAGYRSEFGRDALDFSANVSPLGLPEGVARAIAEALPEADRYPDPLCRSLRSALSGVEGLPADYILCGNGAADLIFRLVWAKKPRRALITAPTFAEYEAALHTVGCDITYYSLRASNDFALTVDILPALKDMDLVFLCQPNNPTGQLTDRALLETILDCCARQDTTLAVDECFLDFLPDRDQWTMKEALADHKNLLILKAFTKLYAMAGVRLGYCLCSDQDLLDKMRDAGQPWAVSSLAQAAGQAALRETDYADSVRELIARQRPVLATGLRALGLRVIDGAANYLLFQGPEGLGETLRQKGAVVRSCANYQGLDSTWYRTAVRTEEENRQLLEIMGEVLR